MSVSRGGRSVRKRWIAVLVRWTVIVGALTMGLLYITGMPWRSYSGPFHPLSEDEMRLRDSLQKHVTALAEDIGERNIWHNTELQAAAGYVKRDLEHSGYSVSVQEYECKGVRVENIEAELPGADNADEIVIVGAHYDSVVGSPGANDNGSGVAALLEIARLLAGKKFSRTVRFVAFVNEEPPFYLSDSMGSRVYAVRSRARGERIVAMLSLETIGHYSDEPGSQHYPFPFALFYPHTGNFIGFVGNMSSRRLVHRVIAAFRKHARFPSEGVAAPGWITGIGWSDHWSFWKEGYPAIMVTDTAPFRYEHYHSVTDTPDRLEYDRMARAAVGLAEVVADLCGRAAER